MVFGTDRKLQIFVNPENIRLRPGPEDPYRWRFLPAKQHLFCKQLSKHCTREYKEIIESIDIGLEAVSVEEYNREPIAEDAPPTEQLSNSDIGEVLSVSNHYYSC